MKYGYKNTKIEELLLKLEKIERISKSLTKRSDSGGLIVKPGKNTNVINLSR